MKGDLAGTRSELMGNETTRLLRDLVRFPSIGPGSETTDALLHLANFLDRHGIVVSIEELESGAPLLLATIDSGAPGQSVLLQGHIDVVPADDGWNRDPFSADLINGTVHGRGTCDMKAGLASFATTLTAMAGASDFSRGRVTLLVDTDEETGSDACLIPWIAKNGLDEFDVAICGEPTGLRPFLGNRGLLWAEITFEGKAAHAGYPSSGVNPVPTACRFITTLKMPDPIASPYGSSGPTLIPTSFHSGISINSIADRAVLGLDRRLVPGESPEAVIAGLVRQLDDFAVDDGVEVGIKILKTWPPCLLDEGSQLATVARDISRDLGVEDSFSFDDACNDASFLTLAGVPTLIWGPGPPERAHSSNESIEVSSLELANRAYVEACLRLTGSSS